MIIAETDRLIIDKLTLKDAPFMLELLNTPNWHKYIGDRNVKSVKEAETYLTNGILKSYKDSGFGFYKLLLKEENNKIIGTAGLVKREQLDHVDIGFAMLPEYERKGFGYEASVTIMDLAKNQFNLKKIVAITQENNLNSITLLKKLGMVYEKTVKPFDNDEELLLFAKTF